YRARYPHVLVDEYQDLNLAQERLVELIAGGGDPVVVGDDDQSIYRFRGASRARLERFLSAFPRAQTVTLGRNHRSSRRTNALARPIAAALAARGLPHVVIGGHGFNDRPEIKDVIALLRVLRDPNDLVALARAVTRPPASLRQESALAVLRDRKETEPLEALRQWAPASTFARLIAELSAAAAVLDVRDLFFELMNRT